MSIFRIRFISIIMILGTVTIVPYSWAALPALPEGNTGIAATYPNDTNIKSNANVLFADGFDSYTSVSHLTSSGNWTSYWQASNIILDTSTYSGGTKSIRLRMPQTGSELGNAITKTISPTRDTLFMRFYTRFQPTYAGMYDAHNGIAFAANYSGPGVRPNGTDFFYVSIENRGETTEGAPGYTTAYVYHPEQDDIYGETWYPDGHTTNGLQSFGPYFTPRPNKVPARDVWIAYEVMVQANTPGSRDGRIAVWENGVLIADWQNIRFRDVDTVKIDQIALSNGGKRSSQINDKWYDNVVIATSYIGPMVSGSSLQPPTTLRIVP